MTARRPALVAGLVGAAAVGAAATVSLTGGQARPPAPTLPRLTTATVTRATLSESALAEGTLGYGASAPVVNALAGTYTWLPAPARTVRPGQVLYRIDNAPVVLLRGSVPAWRPFQLGMTSGPDVRQLSAALIAEHFATGLLTAPGDAYTWATAAAVERWQAAHGLTQTGQIPLGQVVFLPGAVRVGAWQVAVGGAAQPGQEPYLVTTDRRIVTVPLNSDLPVIRVGQSVGIVLPSQASTAGVVSSIGPLPPTASASAAGSGSTGSGSAGGGSAGSGSAGSGSAGSGSAGTTVAQSATSFLFITPVSPAATGTGDGVAVQVSLTIQVARNVLSAPVSALLALAGGGYGVEVVLPSGAHRLIGVHTGIFASGLVQVSGADLTAGTKVVVSQ
ncbi:MAG TPA: peptidoglycan-binding domain-containing protein [Streptosporangiaceae bacterium]|nr:peptidoglycan-binding domain-containing protein [Streptosporangiaceae bacterium]